MKKRNHIIICANDVTQIGGISRVIHSMAEGFEKKGYQITLLGMNSLNGDNTYQNESDQSTRYPVVIPYSEIPPARTVDSNRWNRLRGEAVGYMRRYLESIEISNTIMIVLHVYVMEHLLETGVKIGQDDGLAVLGMYHSSFESCKKIGDLKRVKNSYQHATRFFALTQKDRDMYAAEGLTNASYIYNPVELLTQPAILSHKDRSKRVIFMGRFSKEKRIPLIVEAWEKIIKKHPDWDLDIYGVGPDEALIAQIILAKGLADSVHLKGKSLNPEQELANSRLMVMASEYEGLPVVIVEAGLCSTPTLAINCSPGMEVLIENKVTGVLVDNSEVQSFADALDSLLENEETLQDMGTAAFEKMQQFSIDKVIAQWEVVFEELELI